MTHKPFSRLNALQKATSEITRRQKLLQSSKAELGEHLPEILKEVEESLKGGEDYTDAVKALVSLRKEFPERQSEIFNVLEKMEYCI